jgi:hypothetical protein
VDADRSPTNVRVVPDLGDELLIVIDRLGALLGSVAIWEMEDDVGLRAQFADGKALDVAEPLDSRCMAVPVPRSGQPPRTRRSSRSQERHSRRREGAAGTSLRGCRPTPSPRIRSRSTDV